MALNPKYVTAPSIQSYLVDKDSGLPLSGGKIFYYRDTNRTELKSVYELQGNQANYTYAPLPNPVILSAVGTIQDNNGNDVIPYYYPFDEFGDVDLYYIVVQNSLGVPQFTRQAWPNPDFDNEPASSDDRFNYIPNGQLLAHTDLPDNELVAGSNVIAQGGFTVELEDPLLSTNTLEFIRQQFTQAPPQSPRYLMQFTCSAFDTSETIKNIRVKWTDVNKFSTKPGTYTFAFWATSNVSLPVAINVVKFYGTGGSPSETIPQALTTITSATAPTLYQFEINFGINSGKTVGAEDDFIAIDISLPRNIAFVSYFTDFVLFSGSLEVLNFPVQTDADMMARGVFGWADKIDPEGMDLYLPPILTKQGMTWDASQVGTIGFDIVSIDSPSASPAPQHNKMPCDGATYITEDFSSNGIPFLRLQSILQSKNPHGNNLPLYGTGSNFVSALVPFSGASNTTFRIVYNNFGTGSTLAADGAIATGFTFSPMYLYNGVSTGTTTQHMFSSKYSLNAFSMIINNNQYYIATTNSGTSGFTFTGISAANELLAFQGNSNNGANEFGYAITAVPASSLPNGPAAGAYFNVHINGDGQRFFWYNKGTNALPAPPSGGTPIQINIGSDYTARDIADVTREAILGYAATNITVPALPPAGSYFTFSSNAGALRNFYVWFQINTAGVITGVDPAPPGRTGILVVLFSTDTANQIRGRTRDAINNYQYQAPDFRGMFFRAADPNATWDEDAATRWSYTAGVFGANAGTFEYQQFLSHFHSIGNQPLNNGGAALDGGTPYSLVTANSNNSGGSETRPVNAYVYPYIRY